MPDLLREILERNERAVTANHPSSSFRKIEIFYHVNVMNQDSFSRKGDVDWWVIRLVTLFEVFLRNFVSSVVDDGGHCRLRAVSLIRNIPGKALAEAIVRIQEQKFSVGELAAHVVTCSRVDQIIGCLTEILGEEFVTKMKTAKEAWSEDTGLETKGPIIADWDTVVRDIGELLEARHVIVHEGPRPDATMAKERAVEAGRSVHAFCDALEWVVTIEKYGSVARTNAEMKKQAFARLATRKSELQALEENLVETPEDAAAVAEVKKTFNSYCDAAASYAARYHLSPQMRGTIAPLIYAGTFLDLIEVRLGMLTAQKQRRDRAGN